MPQLTLKSIVAEMWDEFDKQAVNYGLVPGDVEKIIILVPNTVLRIGESLLGFWNSLAKGGWATIGPRMLGPAFESGTLTKVGKRTFLAPAPMGSKTAIVIEKVDGKAGAECVFAVHGRKGDLVQRKTIMFPTNSSTSAKRFEVADDKFGIVSVELDAKMPTLRVDKFEYRIKYEERPQMTTEKSVKGFADLHVHQMAQYAYMGNWLHGSHTGAASKALAPCGQFAHAIPDVIWNYLLSTGAPEPKVFHGRGHPTYEDWPHHLDMGHQQVHEAWLADAHKRGLNLIIACPVNNEPFSLIMGAVHPTESTGGFRDMPVINRQIQQIHEFARNHSWYKVVLNPWQARQAIHEGKLAVVISAECSNLFPRDQGDFIDQLDELYQMGVRCLQIAHEVDSRFAGCALQERIFSVLETIKRLTKLDLGLGFQKDEEGHNKLGLTEDGEKLVNAIMDRHMLLDTAHLSLRALEGVFKIAQRRQNYPLINSHTKFYTILTTEEREVQREFLTFDDQIRFYTETGGIVGLRTAPWRNRQAPLTQSRSQEVQTDDGEIGTTRSYAQQVTYAHDNELPMAIGTDINGFTNQLGPRLKDGKKPAAVSTEYWNHGLRHIGLLPDLVEDLKALKTPGATTLGDSAEFFIQSWERTWIRNLATK
jgi:microsomal dipeptidase-like Zn-dependent dipeptidase